MKTFTLIGSAGYIAPKHIEAKKSIELIESINK